MKKLISLAVGMMMATTVFSQSVQRWTENFDGTVTFTSSPALAWERDANYSTSPPYAYLGTVPNVTGGISTLETQTYNLSAYQYVSLRFKHICKVSPQDMIRIEYKITGQMWQIVSPSAYRGKAVNYLSAGFNTNSYPEWITGSNLTLPSQSWWKEEWFDLSFETAGETSVQFRFVIQHGNVPGTQVSYGWLLDDIEIAAATHELDPPVVAFTAPLVRGNVYNVGPWEINAKVKTQTNAPITPPYLKYTLTNNGITSALDSLPMTNVRGDSLWQTTIPASSRDTKVDYFITGRDTLGNHTTVTSWYHIQPMEGNNYTDNSVGMVSIDINDTVVVSSQTPVSVPIVATVKNVGDLNLTSATMYYSVNAGAAHQYNWTGNLTKEDTDTDTLGYYSPRFGEYDLICVWVERPNGVTDSIVGDDTLRKYVYGSCDIIMAFYNYLGDTVYTTGPHQIMAAIHTLSGNIPASVSLHTVATKDGTSLHDSVLMSFDVSQNLWTVNLPHYEYGSKVVYSITKTDILGNVVSIIDSFYIKRITADIPLNEIMYPPGGAVGISMSGGGIYESNQPVSWSRHFYDASATGADVQDVLITRIAWHAASGTGGQIRTDFNIYMQVTSLTANPAGGHIDPVANRAVLVYKGTFVSKTGWNEVILDRPLFIPQGRNLIVYIEDKTGYITLPTEGMMWDLGGFFVAVTTVYSSGNGFISNPIFFLTRFSTGGLTATKDNNSVALETINSPASIDVLPNTSVPVHVTVRNRGFANLTSCYINWTLNDVLQVPYHYTGNLPEDFTDTATIGYYTPSNGTLDDIVVWVSMPNGIADNITSDDTLYFSTVACSYGGLSGNYVIGSSASADFPSLELGLSVIQTCGINGKVTFFMENGIYPESVNLSVINNVMTGNDTLVITSLSGNAQNVIIQTSKDGITLLDNRNIIIKAITVDVSSGNNAAVKFMSSSSNIVIRDCRLLANPTTTATTSAPIYKSSSGMVDSIFIVNNLLDGGYYGFYFYGGTGTAAYGTNVIFDSNIVSNQYYYGAYTYYTNYISCSYNTILSRTNNTGTSWQALRFTSAYGPVVGNKIIQRSTAILQPHGIYATNHNYPPDTVNPDTALIANNEIILSISGTTITAGIQMESSHCKIVHNSIYVAGTEPGRGIYLTNSANDNITVKNNNIMMTSASAYPVYLSGTSNLSKYDIDYNNMYAPTYAGYAGANKVTIANWQQTVTTDLHSVRILPQIQDPAISLKPVQLFGLSCNAFPSVDQDIEGVTRTNPVTMGCYEVPFVNGNGMLEAIIGLRDGFMVGQTDEIKTIITNTGTSPITSVNLGWSVNGVIQNDSIDVSASLLQGQFDTVSIGQLNYTAGNTTVKVWINTLNDGNLADVISRDDTLSVSGFICNGNFSGTLIIGATGDFPTVEEAHQMLLLCGVDGDVTLAFQSGIHTGNLNLTNSSALFGNYSLTLTSVSGNSSDVIFTTPKGVAILCNNTSNLIIKDITVDATRGSYGIQFTGTASSIVSDIIIDNCRILANPTATNNAFAGIHKATNTGSLNGLSITNCTIDGGYYGIYLYGTSAIYCRNIVIDNNTITNQSYQGMYLYYVNTNSISYNRITPRTSNTNTTWQALYAYYLRNGGNIIGNRISANTATITSTLTGMYLYYTDTALVANNEIYLNGNASTTDGIYVYYPRDVRVINNTVYTVKSGTAGTNRAHYNYVASGYGSTVRNNIFTASGGANGTTYAFYCYGSAANFNSYKVNYDLDYNDYYSSGSNIGYIAGANQPTLAAWKTAAASPLDDHSINVFPDFGNPGNNLIVQTYSDTFSCPRWQNIEIDLQKTARPATTSMGAYTQCAEGQDLMLLSFSEWDTEVIKNQTIPVIVTLFNSGNVPVTSAALQWSINGATQQPVLLPTALTLNPSQQTVISVGSFSVADTVTDYDIVVWIDDINGEPDTLNWNDTLRISTMRVPLAEFAAPFVPDTITDLSFDVNIRIRPWTGATIIAPQLTIVSAVAGSTAIYDTLPMTAINDIWQATIPPQYYGAKVVYSLSLTDTIGNIVILTDSTCIRDALSIFGDTALLSLSLEEPLNIAECIPDYSPVKIALTNPGSIDYDFMRDSIILELEVTDPKQVKHTASVPYTGVLQAGGNNVVELMSSLPLTHKGTYHIKIWVNNPSNTVIYKDTLYYTYISDKTDLPIDVNFSNGMPSVFEVWSNNASAAWTVIPQGTGADTAVLPQFGTGVLSFGGSRGDMSTFTTRQMDLRHAVDPSLSLWYFHDTLPSKDYTEVRITVDGGITYTTLLSLTKYNAVYGWKQYDVDLPAFAIDQCVILVFEAMEKSLNGDVTQYIDRIRVTAKQDIAVKDVFVSDLSACDMQNKTWNVVLENLTYPALDYAVNPTKVTLEITGTSYIFEKSLTGGALAGFSLDTIVLDPTMDFTPDEYNIKAYYTSTVIDENPANDEFISQIDINPDIDIAIRNISTVASPAHAETACYQEVTITNTGNMDLQNIKLVLRVPDGNGFTDIASITRTLSPDSSEKVIFNNAYAVPWSAQYLVEVNAYLECDSAMLNKTTSIQEYVNMSDLYIVEVTNPGENTKDNAGEAINVSLRIQNRNISDVYNEGDVEVGILIKDKNGSVIGSVALEELPEIGSAEIFYTFNGSYIVPHGDPIYHLIVYLTSKDNYPMNDTAKLERSVNVSTLDRDGLSFSMEQNVPNPAKESTIINYSVPQDGEIVFQIYSISGQLLYIKQEDVSFGNHRIELNLADYAAGVYFYTMEYKGQRLVKRMSIKR
jgi:hypothetical protein